MEVQKTDITRFLELAGKLPVADVRSPSEFRSGHIPDAVNIPLFDDKEREAVGIRFNNEGRIAAILEGLRLTGPALNAKLKEAVRTAHDSSILVHCWRGGMRSETMSWLFSLADLKVTVLEGGYKLYRHHVLNALSEKRNTIILGGMTGSGKTNILRAIREKGQQVIDLEGLANHKGSAFGALGLKEQPTSEQFANDLFVQWSTLSENSECWLEDESINIGTVFMPESFFRNMQAAPLIVLEMDKDLRISNLLEGYAAFDPEQLKVSVNKLRKRLGGTRANEAIGAIDSGDLTKAIDIVLYYYDKAYDFSLKRKPAGKVLRVITDTTDTGENALKVLGAATSITN